MSLTADYPLTLESTPAARHRNSILSTVDGIVTKPRRRPLHEDTVDSLLDRLSDMREELLSIERSLERVQIASLEHEKAGSRKSSRITTQGPLKGLRVRVRPVVVHKLSWHLLAGL